VLRLEEEPTPEPGPGQVLVRVAAAGINPVDTYIRSGTYAAKPALPYTPGADAAGTVEAIGGEAGKFKVGDRVYVGGSLSGTYAEYVLCTAIQVHALPERITFSQGAGINIPYATAYRALFQRAHGVPGETVLIHGATGGVGLAAIQWAVAAGLNIIATGGSEAGRELVAAQGAQHVLDHRAPNYQEQILGLTGGKGVDVILEMLSNVNLGTDLRLLAKGGRVAVIGSRGPVEINPRDAMSRDATILGVMLGNTSERDMGAIHAAIGAGLANGTLRPVVGRELRLEQAAQGHVSVMEAGARGKIVLVT